MYNIQVGSVKTKILKKAKCSMYVSLLFIFSLIDVFLIPSTSLVFTTMLLFYGRLICNIQLDKNF